MRKAHLSLDRQEGPLYAQIRTLVVARISAGRWLPGAAIPTEMELARELGVSQGTVRKALDALAAEGVLVRRQGSGTYVAEHTPAHILFRFFNIYEDSGRQVLPESHHPRVTRGRATGLELRRLGLVAGAKVLRISRVRLRRRKPFMTDRIVLPEALFPGLAQEPEIPNTLYDLLQQRYGVHVAHTEERVSAVAADRRTAARLAVPAGTPLLKIDRVTIDLNGQRIEWRLSFAHLTGAHYLARLR